LSQCGLNIVPAPNSLIKTIFSSPKIVSTPIVEDMT
jgi:hypothetical protein